MLGMRRSDHRLLVPQPARLLVLLGLIGCGQPAQSSPPAVPVRQSTAAGPGPGTAGAAATEPSGPSDPRIAVVGLSFSRARNAPSLEIGQPASEVPGLPAGTVVHFRFSDPSRRVLGLKAERSRLIRLRDDQGRDLLDDAATVREAGLAVSEGEPLRFHVRTPKLPSPGAKQITVDAKLAIQFSATMDTKTATLPAGGLTTVYFGTCTVELSRQDGLPPPSRFSQPAPVTSKATTIEYLDRDPVQRYLEEIAFVDAKGNSLRPVSTMTSFTSKDGESSRTRRYVLDHTEDDLQIKLTVATPRTELVPLHATVDLGLSDTR
jgi:hypothetical protein